MLALARYTLKGPYQAAAVVGLLAVLAVLIPLMMPSTFIGVLLGSVCMLLSCALVGLIILTQGSVSGLQPIGVSIIGITLVAWVLIGAPMLGLWTGLMQWLPIILLAQTLRSSKSLALTMLVGLLLGAGGIAVQYLGWSDLETEITAQTLQHMEQAGQPDADIVEMIERLVQYFVQAIVAAAYLMFMLIVLTARWMQAKIADSNGFGQEFQALSLGKPAAGIALALMLLSFWAQQTWLISLAFLMVIAFMFQGVAVAHSKLLARKQSRLLLGVFYALLLVFQQVALLTAIVGVMDNWLVFRKKSVKPNDENEIR